MYRVAHPNQLLVSGQYNANGNDGDAAFRNGIVNNNFEVLPVLDIKDNNFGMHFSGEYFINTVYLQGNQNSQPGAASSVNPVLAKSSDFPSETRTANGMNGRMLDAFVYDSWNIGGGQQFTLKAGQQTLFWGQSLFFPVDGISGGQAPIDTVAADQLVNPQAQQVFLPVGQIVATYQPNSTYTIQGYYQYQWEPYSFNGVGSYFSEDNDVLGPGGSRLILANGLYALRTKDLSPPSQNGQFGLSVQAQYGNFDVGLYGLRFDAKVPNVYLNLNVAPSLTPGGYAVGRYTAVYPRDIWLYGTGVSTTIGATNVAGEFSVRTHQPLVTGAGIQTPENMGNANNDPLYPVGNTMTGLASFIYSSQALPFDPGGVTMEGEVQYVDVFRVTANKALLAPGRSSAASAFDVEVEPTYFDVLPNLEVQFPVSLSYTYAGNSQMDSSMNHGTGSYTLSISATYRSTWDASLNYVGYFGKPSTSSTSTETSISADRGYLSLNLAHTF
jgi:hypothetical protein